MTLLDCISESVVFEHDGALGIEVGLYEIACRVLLSLDDVLPASFPESEALTLAIARLKIQSTRRLEQPKPTLSHKVPSYSAECGRHLYNLQASERHCLADSYLPPSLLAAPAAIADTNHSIAANVLAIGQLQSEGLRPIKLAKQRSWDLLESYLPFLVMW